ncbi:hypothetical protein HK096_002604 [Nowakowskiella sp. JEL0078]|nr:hypothetical protein HK096_002604 [Nowakowskiella sp. JEL0078]
MIKDNLMLNVKGNNQNMDPKLVSQEEETLSIEHTNSRATVWKDLIGNRRVVTWIDSDSVQDVELNSVILARLNQRSSLEETLQSQGYVPKWCDTIDKYRELEENGIRDKHIPVLQSLQLCGRRRPVGEFRMLKIIHVSDYFIKLSYIWSPDGIIRDKYVAATYSWADPTVKSDSESKENRDSVSKSYLSIIIDGNEANLNKNSLFALRTIVDHARKIGLSHIWLDYLCAGQVTLNSKVEEKLDLECIMGNLKNVFKRATAVCVILKTEIDDLHVGPNQELTFNHGSWWRRAWTAAEGALAKERILFYYSGNEISGADLLRKLDSQIASLKTNTIVESHALKTAKLILNGKLSHTLKEMKPAMAILWMYGRESERPEDLVYAAVAMTSGLHDFKCKYEIGFHQALKLWFDRLSDSNKSGICICTRDGGFGSNGGWLPANSDCIGISWARLSESKSFKANGTKFSHSEDGRLSVFGATVVSLKSVDKMPSISSWQIEAAKEIQETNQYASKYVNFLPYLNAAAFTADAALIITPVVVSMANAKIVADANNAKIAYNLFAKKYAVEKTATVTFFKKENLAQARKLLDAFKTSKTVSEKFLRFLNFTKGVAGTKMVTDLARLGFNTISETKDAVPERKELFQTPGNDVLNPNLLFTGNACQKVFDALSFTSFSGPTNFISGEIRNRTMQALEVRTFARIMTSSHHEGGLTIVVCSCGLKMAGSATMDEANSDQVENLCLIRMADLEYESVHLIAIKKGKFFQRVGSMVLPKHKCAEQHQEEEVKIGEISDDQAAEEFLEAFSKEFHSPKANIFSDPQDD